MRDSRRQYNKELRELTIMISHVLERRVYRILHICSRRPLAGVRLITNQLSVEDIGFKIVALLHSVRKLVPLLIVSTFDRRTRIDGVGKSIASIANKSNNNHSGKTGYETCICDGNSSSTPECQLDGSISPAPTLGKMNN
jgi:hypothetical protein